MYLSFLVLSQSIYDSLKVFLPPIGGLTVYIFGHPEGIQLSRRVGKSLI